MRVKSLAGSYRPIPFLAVILSVYTPPVVGVPESVAVPSPLSLNVTPGGSSRTRTIRTWGTPVDVTVKVPAWPTVKVAWSGLVIWHAWLTVRVKPGGGQDRHRSWR